MADVLKLLVTTPANRSPAATTNTTVYTTPGSTTAMLSRVMICNRGAAGSFRIALVESGGTIGNQHYIAYDAPIGANDSYSLPVGAGLATGDFIVVYSSNGSMTFTPMGIEVTA